MSNRPRNFRQRRDVDGGDDGGEDKPNSNPPPKKPSAVTAAAKPKKKSLLSFADDEEQEEALVPPQAKIKKSHKSSTSASHKISSARDRSSHGQGFITSSNVQPQAGIYTKEALLELQKNTRTLVRPAASASSSSSVTNNNVVVVEPQIVLLKGLIKPENNSVGDNDNHDDDREEKESDCLDQATINAIKAKRERMRLAKGAAPDFISLDTGGVVGASAADGLSDDEPEFRERIAMFGAATGKKKGVFEDEEANIDNGYGLLKKKIAASSVMVEDSNGNGDDEDDEDMLWEEEQLRKAVGKRMDDGSRSSSSRVANSVIGASTTVSVHTKYQQLPTASGYGPMAVSSIGGAIGASVPALDGMSVAQKAEVARKAMQDNLRRLKESQVKTSNSLAKADENLTASLLNITSLEKSLSAAEEKFIFMQKFRQFLSVLCDFLQHKAPFIEELEEQIQESNKQRASAITKRRASDSEDETMELEAAVSAAKSVFNERGSIAAATSAAESAAASVREQTNLPVKLDEFGRDENLKNRMDMKRRAEARQRRKVRSESKKLSSMEIDGAYQKIEGESSTDESETETEAYESNRNSLIQVADSIFCDAAEEYSQLSVVKERLESWKRDYSSSYRDAYMSLSTPTIFAPYVKLELLKWDPLHEDADFSDMKWHSLLFSYGQPKDGSDFSSDDADANLIPLLVEEVALPILHHELQYCWDVLSTRETKNAVSATSLVTIYVDPSSRKLAELIAAIRDRLADVVANIKVPAWSSLELKAVPNAARFVAYRFGMSVRLIRNICLWKEILALPVLEKLVLDELLCRKILPHVRSIASDVHDAVTRTERIVTALSGVWSGPSVTGNRSHKLQPLVDYIMSLGKTVEKRRSSMDERETNGLSRRLKKMLVELNEYDYAREIAKTFHLKEAL
ncbi:hypothetical protein ACFE04_016592 [Oxalis oulophora]